MAFAVACNTPNIRFWRSSWSLAGALTCLLRRGFAGTVCASNLLGQFVVTIPAISIIPISVLSYNFMTIKSTDVLPDSLQFFKLVFSECVTSNTVSVLPSMLVATNASKFTACLVHLLKCRLSSLSWINIPVRIVAASETSSLATIRTSFSSVLLWNTVSLWGIQYPCRI